MFHVVLLSPTKVIHDALSDEDLISIREFEDSKDVAEYLKQMQRACKKMGIDISLAVTKE